jgi:hypothetical protein
LRIDYEALPVPVREAVEERCGSVRSARSVDAGTNCVVASFLETHSGPVFVKGLPKNHPGVVDQQREARVAPFVSEVSPRLLWHTEVEGWDLLGFEAIWEGRPADYAPGSGDVARVFALLERLAATPCPAVAMFSAERRWGSVLDDPNDAKHFAGTSLLHTDWHQHNIVVAGERAWLVDWAWATWGAAFIDPALLVARLIAAGHTPAEAEGLAEGSTAWVEADQTAVTLFSQAVARLVRKLADGDPSGHWRRPMVEATREWAEYRKIAYGQMTL